MSRHTFDFPHDLSPFPRSSQDLLRMAHALGWTMRWQGTNKHVVTLTSPIETTKTVNVPSTNLNDARHKSTVRTLARYSDPEKVEDYIDSQVTVRGSAALRLALDIGPEPPKEAPRRTALAIAMEEAKSTTEVTQVEHVVEVSRTRDSDDVMVYRSTDVDPVPVPETTLVTTKPWMVRRGGVDGGSGTMYESPVVIERIWADGEKDYRCKSCEFCNLNPRSVSSHSARKHKDGQGKAEQPRGYKVNAYEATDLTRPRSAVRRMRSELMHLLDSMDDWASVSPDDLAERLAEGLYDTKPDREPVAPLSSEQVISRISYLVDNGRLADLHQQMERMAETMREQSAVTTAAQIEAERLRHEVERLREERKVLASLLADDKGVES